MTDNDAPSPDPLAPPVDLLAIAAHRDDVELLCGGTMARMAAQGYRTGILDLTAGERGTDGSAQLRGEESDAAAVILGVTARRNAGLPDAGLQNTPETRQLIAGFVRAFRPRVVIIPFMNGRHPDHRIASQLAYDACFLAGLAKLDAPGAPHRPEKILYALTYREDAIKPSFVVDITDFMETKMKAVHCYSSQFDGKTWGGEVFPGGDRPLYDQVRMHAARYGSLIRTEYGEPFHIAETMRVDDVLTLGVRSI
ncbi:bacillithiol biosynthesis deacetylase BshB1 [Longimicrobium terrae]|uniref:Bacillithiol biosynthesis deacetylase BshB1 n=1 Tax=Longimicrobium terrae TaxID=1639882 RepID=A0A841GSG4_9BACT|nr:bacillithiol biosynthesis deacetylase BshB1 [Longimicrobium terrae]MBB6070210.1 bacillithiol biosynthesis deacetylase BshB1 [Longimicrobium terrae]NNC30716.1 bacillithiol biosynthesis deacetylase BshB1 [Longimicrobium terrae]